jgi:phosphoglycolate phosphatase-like HAD superfamily hydrolase
MPFSMHLVIFDIDGTLTDTMPADEVCFVRSFAEVCGFSEIDTDWSGYRHTTDSSIFKEIYEARTGRPPAEAEVSRFRQHFIDLLRQAASESAFLPVAGAPQLLASLGHSVEYRVSLATGGWRDSARLKMASAGLCYDDFPAASSDEAFEREAIITLSAQRATERFGGFDRSVYVGDGVWDARACRAIGIPFIGIGSEVRAQRLTAEGAVQVFPDLTDKDSFFRTLDEITNAG